MDDRMKSKELANDKCEGVMFPIQFVLLGTLTIHCLFVFSYVFTGLLMELCIRIYMMMIKQWNNKYGAYIIKNTRYNKEHQYRSNNVIYDLYLDSR
jgi:hypothetical protein